MLSTWNVQAMGSVLSARNVSGTYVAMSQAAHGMRIVHRINSANSAPTYVSLDQTALSMTNARPMSVATSEVVCRHHAQAMMTAGQSRAVRLVDAFLDFSVEMIATVSFQGLSVLIMFVKSLMAVLMTLSAVHSKHVLQALVSLPHPVFVSAMKTALLRSFANSVSVFQIKAAMVTMIVQADRYVSQGRAS